VKVLVRETIYPGKLNMCYDLRGERVLSKRSSNGAKSFFIANSGGYTGISRNFS
jgi:hypothetical protein